MADDLSKRSFERWRFRVGIICALGLEAEMIEMILDKQSKEDIIDYGKATNDPNAYTTGTIAGCPVVLAFCPGMGSNSAAQVASSLRSSFTQVKIILVVGICGAVPSYQNQGSQEIMLGDCIISTGIIQFDLGRKGPAGFSYKQGLHGLGRPTSEIRALMEKLQTRTNRSSLTAALISSLQLLQRTDPDQTSYPGKQHDRLYKSEYTHTHRSSESCGNCDDKLGLCNQSCEELDCETQFLENRKRLETDVLPVIHFGCYGSSNTVLKSAIERDDLAKNDIIAFEMEGSGVWEVCPTVIIKSACDYADSHKNKRWQKYAAAVAAAMTRAFLQELKASDDQRWAGRVSQSYSHAHTSIATSTLHSESDSDVSSAIRVADAAIRNYYDSSNRLQIERLSGEKLSLDKCYINLALTDRSDRSAEESHSFLLIDRLELEAGSIGELVPLERLFESRKLCSDAVGSPRRIFIQGRAGVGKTTLCKKLVYEFLNGRLAPELFDRLLWIPLRKLRNRTEEYGWKDLIQDTHLLQDSKWKQVKESYTDQFYSPSFLTRTLLLFDGLDEVSDRGTQREDDRMFEFLGSIICDSPNVIITSRPQSKSIDIGRFDLELETTGFLPDQIRTYIENCVSRQNVIADMMSFISARPLIKGLLRIPIQLDAFCCTWSSLNDAEYASISSSEANSPDITARDSITTMTTLYYSISLELCRKDLGRLKPTNQPQKLTNFEVNQSLEMELKLLGELAFQGMMNNIIEYSPKHLDKITSHAFRNGLQLSDSCRSVLDKLSFIRTSDIEQDQSKRNYHFLHLTFQEFFAARHFVEHWQSNRPLVLLQLVFWNKAERMLPSRFLQLQKYDPSLNIFWRFATGLIQIQFEDQDESNRNNRSAVEFFNDLDDKPIDVLGLAHQRLIMCCLSEVASSDRQDIQQLRLQKEHVLREAAIEEYKIIGSIYYPRSIQTKAEFPEDVWYGFLQDSQEIPCSKVLEGLVSRPYISVRLLSAVCSFMGDSFDMTVREHALEVACKHFTTGTKEMQAHIVQAFRTISRDRDGKYWCYNASSDEFNAILFSMLRDENEDLYTRKSAASFLFSRSVSSANYIEVSLLATIFENEKEANDLRYRVGEILKWQKSISHEVILGLFTVMNNKNEDPKIRRSALQVLGTQKAPLPDCIIVVLLMMLLGTKDENSNLRADTEYVLGRQASLPGETILALAKSFEAEIQQDQTREAIMVSIWKRLCSQAESTARMVVLLKKELQQVASFAERFLIEQSTLPQGTINLLITMLKEEVSDVRSSAAGVLSSRSSLPQEALNLLIAMLEDEDCRTQDYVTTVLSSQLSLPQEVIDFFVAMSKHEDYKMRYHATIILSSQLSLPQEIIPSIVSILKDKDKHDQNIRRKIMLALRNKSHLPQEILSTITMITKDTKDKSKGFSC